MSEFIRNSKLRSSMRLNKLGASVLINNTRNEENNYNPKSKLTKITKITKIQNLKNLQEKRKLIDRHHLLLHHLNRLQMTNPFKKKP